MPEIVYVLTNEAMPGIVKIGCTQGDLATRVRSLFQTGVPLPFEVFFACEVNDCKFVERQLHDAFGDHRLSKSREFFRLAPERVKAALLIGARTEVRVGEEVFENLPETLESASDIKAEVQAAKRRSRMTFAMIGLPPGSVLRLQKDLHVTCTVADEINNVIFQGDTMSASRAALHAINALGYDWQTAAGPWEWTYEGRRLDDIRRAIQDGAD